MPIQTCREDGESGYRWGQSGTCYTGKNAQRKALKQGVAIEEDRKRRGEPSYFDSAAGEFLKLAVEYAEQFGV